jgi:hypothetical protein
MPPFEIEFHPDHIQDMIGDKLLQFRKITPKEIVYRVEVIDSSVVPWKIKVFTRKEQEVKVITHKTC